MREWPVLRAPRWQLAYFAAVEIAALAWVGYALADLDNGGRTWPVLGLLTVLAVVFEEVARRAARLQLRLSSSMKRDMTSVWCVAGAVAMQPGSAAVLLTILMTYIWVRQQRPADEILHRKIFNASTVLLGMLGSGAILHALRGYWAGSPWMLAGAVSVVVVIVAYTTINRALVTVGVLLMGIRGRVLLGSADDNLIEIATLCLGGLVALAVLYQPWLAALVLAPMITLQRGALVRELEAAATVDAKTGLLNAVAWEHLAQRELARAARDDYDVAVLIIDIDRFKLVNDQYGHLVGDQVLRNVGKVLAAEVREYDTVGRFGGEEFVAVLPKAGDADALVVAERLRSRVNELRISALAGASIDGAALATAAEHALAVSIGVSCSRHDGREVAELLVAADAALYRAKSRGRNRVVLAARGEGDVSRSVPAI